MKLSPEQKVSVLTQLLKHYDYMYYVECISEISDTTYDLLKKDLELLEQKYPHLLKPDSPTQLVNGGFV